MSGELTLHGTIAVLVAMVAILCYVWFRFEWQFALAAITTTAHDVIMTIGLFSITGIEFNLSSIAAVLTLVGLSLNETVVISDRIRENLRKYKKMPLPELINLSINQTIVRTSLTAFTIFLALFPLVFFGGEAIRGFVIAMTFGCVRGHLLVHHRRRPDPDLLRAQVARRCAGGQGGRQARRRRRGLADGGAGAGVLSRIRP